MCLKTEKKSQVQLQKRGCVLKTNVEEIIYQLIYNISVDTLHSVLTNGDLHNSSSGQELLSWTDDSFFKKIF